MQSVRSWFSDLSTAAIDRLLVAVVAFPTFMDAWWNQPGTRQADWITYSLGLVAVGSLLWRRRFAYVVTALCAAVLTTWNLMDHFGELLNLPMMVGLYTIARQGNRRSSLITGLVASTWSGLVAELAGTPVGSPTLEMLWPLVPLTLGEAVRQRHELLAEHAAQAARNERLSIAREFHDVVAHTMAAVNVQIEVAVAAFDSKPETARSALLQARTSSKAALDELRGSIAMLRDGESASPHPRQPTPTLSELDALAATARAAGVEVAVNSDVEDRLLPTAVELAAYRIVQESLANVARHAHASTAQVSLTHAGDALVVEVTDDGAGGDRSASHGHGLAGMAERAAALGGQLSYGPCPERGFQVRAKLPIGSAAS